MLVAGTGGLDNMDEVRGVEGVHQKERFFYVKGQEVEPQHLGSSYLGASVWQGQQPAPPLLLAVRYCYTNKPSIR